MALVLQRYFVLVGLSFISSGNFWHSSTPSKIMAVADAVPSAHSNDDSSSSLFESNKLERRAAAARLLSDALSQTVESMSDALEQIAVENDAPVAAFTAGQNDGLASTARKQFSSLKRNTGKCSGLVFVRYLFSEVSYTPASDHNPVNLI